MGKIRYGAAGGANICEISEQWRWETVFGWWNWEEWDFQKHEIVGIGRRELGAGGECAGIYVPKIIFRLLSQLRACVLLLAPGDDLCLLLKLRSQMPSLRTTAIEFLISNAAVHNDGI